MKTSEIIKYLQEKDPSGELEVTVGKTPIHFLTLIAGYYDGCYSVLKHDPELTGKFYDVVGAEIRCDGYHISIETMGIDEMLLDDPEALVTYDSDYTKKKYEERVEQWRIKGRRYL